MLFLVFLTRPGQGIVGRSFRELYPLFLLPALYSELDILNAPSVSGCMIGWCSIGSYWYSECR